MKNKSEENNNKLETIPGDPCEIGKESYAHLPDGTRHGIAIICAEYGSISVWQNGKKLIEIPHDTRSYRGISPDISILYEGYYYMFYLSPYSYLCDGNPIPLCELKQMIIDDNFMAW